MTFLIGFAIGFVVGLRTVGRGRFVQPQSGHQFDYRDSATWTVVNEPDWIWETYQTTTAGGPQ